MKRKNQLTEYNDNIKKVRFSLAQRANKRCADEPIFYEEGYGGASDDDECYYDRKKRLKIANGFIFKTMIPTRGAKAEKNKNNIPSYIN